MVNSKIYRRSLLQDFPYMNELSRFSNLVTLAIPGSILSYDGNH